MDAGVTTRTVRDAVAEHELLRDEAGLDGLAEPDVVGDEERHARHLDGADDGVELVVLHLDAAAEGALERAPVGRGDGPPRGGVEEGVEALGRVEAGGAGEGGPFEDAGAGLDLPDHGELLAEAVVFEGGEGHEVLEAARRRRERGVGEGRGAHVLDDVATAAHLHDLPDGGQRPRDRCCTRRLHAAPARNLPSRRGRIQHVSRGAEGVATSPWTRSEDRGHRPK
jgi:hypothetical protein